MDVGPRACSSCGGLWRISGRRYGLGRCGWLVGIAPLVGLGEGVGRLDPVPYEVLIITKEMRHNIDRI
jgi:hypothetical protein